MIKVKMRLKRKQQPDRVKNHLIIGFREWGKSTVLQGLCYEYLLRRPYIVILDHDIRDLEENYHSALLQYMRHYYYGSEHVGRVGVDGWYKLIGQRKRIIIEAGDLTARERLELVDDLSRAVGRRGDTCFAVDEAHNFYPHESRPSAFFPDALERLVGGGRKRKIDLIFCTQKLVKLNTFVISEADHIYCFSLAGQPDLNRIEKEFERPGISRIIARLPRYQYIKRDKDRPDRLVRGHTSDLGMMKAKPKRRVKAHA